MLFVVACTSLSPDASRSADKISPLEKVDEIPGGGIFESAQDTKLRRDLMLSREIRRSIETLPGVVRARVHLTTVEPSLFAQKSQQDSQAAVIVVRDNGTEPSEQEIRSFVVAAVPKMTPASVRVFFTEEAKRTPDTVFVGPIEVVVSSARRTRLILGVLLGLCLVSAGALIAAGIRLRMLKQRQ